MLLDIARSARSSTNARTTAQSLLHPHGQSFWWLFVEPPIFVVLAGLLFHVFVARALIDDLRESDAAAR